MGMDSFKSLQQVMPLTKCRLNVARLASVPDSILQLAAVKSKELEKTARENCISNLYAQAFLYEKLAVLIPGRFRSLRSLLENPSTEQLDYIINGIEQL